MFATLTPFSTTIAWTLTAFCNLAFIGIAVLFFIAFRALITQFSFYGVTLAEILEQ
jgi:hypothetical protein